nr:hypothetical protein [Tanacetum cinerariifolium]
MVIDKSWTSLGKHEKEFYTGLKKSVDDCKPLVDSAGNIRCPCKSCRLVLWMSDMTACLNELSYIPLNNEQNEPTQGDIGETSNEPTQAKLNEFEELYASANEELYPEFFQNVFPTAKGYKLPPSYYAIKKTFKTIGLGNTLRKKVPKKVLHYFSIIPRLQRLYKSSHTAKEMTWHATGKCTEPGKMQHPVDGKAWKDFDTKYSDFAAEPRNVRLGLAADGFNPELFALACGPSQTPISVNSYVVNGVRFVVHSRDERRTTQNNGICSPGPDEEIYYGQLEQILEFSYLSFKTVLFRVKWFDTSNKGRIQNFVIRNNITQIKENGEAFKNDQYILATQVKQCFYLEDMARRPPGWKVVEHVSHKKFLNGGVIVVEDDPDVIHVDNSSDLTLSTSLNDLEIAALHIDGQSIDVDAPPDIIDVVDEDDDIIDEEDLILHDLADSDDEDLFNLDIDDGVNVVYSSEEED